MEAGAYVEQLQALQSARFMQADPPLGCMAAEDDLYGDLFSAPSDVPPASPEAVVERAANVNTSGAPEHTKPPAAPPAPGLVQAFLEHDLNEVRFLGVHCLLQRPSGRTASPTKRFDCVAAAASTGGMQGLFVQHRVAAGGKQSQGESVKSES